MKNRMLRYALGLVALATTFSSCKTDFDLTGPYSERALVYALLDPLNNPSEGGDGHLFRIQKAFLGEASAFDMALVPDSSYFDPTDVIVQVLDILDGDTLNTWQLDTVSIGNKETGDPTDGTVDFFGPEQRLYKLNEDVLVGHTYMLLIENMVTGYTAFSAIDMMDATTFKWTKPNQSSNATYRGMNFKGNVGDYLGPSVNFLTAKNASRYELWITFFYREVAGNDTTQKTLTWRVKSGNFARTDQAGETSGTFNIPGEQVFSFIGSNLEPKPGVTRILGKEYNNISGSGNKVGPDAFELIMFIAGTEFSNMLEITQGNQSAVLTDNPTFSNITNGLGVFSTRTTFTFSKLVPNDPTDIQEFISGQYTGDLDFTIDD
ncbi:MAG: hypothetical protein JKX84_07180 [Flavobacteriales bacterium]|nr:hypothetical protein [Flavobacteriales bacterium]